MATTVTLSSRSGHNIPQLIKDPDKPVQFYNWKEFLEKYFKPLKLISKYQHFIMNAEEPGVVYCKLSSEANPERHDLLRRKDLVREIKTGRQPRIIHGSGLSIERQWYLFDEISQFFHSDKSKNMTCPKPSVPKQSTSSCCKAEEYKCKKKKMF